MHKPSLLFAGMFILAFALIADERRELRVGPSGHAFDHLGNIGEQADAAAASGATIIYGTGFGGVGYAGFGSPEEMNKTRQATSDYNRRAKQGGIQLAIGYVCATSIVKLETFDRNWSETFRAQFASPPTQWLQQDRYGKPLPSWYGGDYRPACMNNPDWQIYEKFIVRLQIESGHDGIFFDNPTVHPQGCFCKHCMKKFSAFLGVEGKIDLPETIAVEFLRQLAVQRPKDFMRFRCTIAKDFLAEMRRFARTIKRDALITCNNSLNSPGVFFSQCRDYGYDIYEMTKAEDFVVVEDMGNQPRVLPNGSGVEYGYVYKMLRAISHGKPVAAVTLADADYHTPPNLVRLAMAEAVANHASYLSWPTWPENQRAQMIAAIRPQADFLRSNSALLNEVQPRADVLLFLPFRKWVDAPNSWALEAATVLSRSNLQYEVVCEDDLVERLQSNSAQKSILLLESAADLSQREKEASEKFKKKSGQIVEGGKGSWLTQIQGALKQPSIIMDAPPTVRASVFDQKNKTIVHLFNLNVQKLSSFEDKVTPATNVQVKVRIPFANVRTVETLSAEYTSRSLPFTREKNKKGSWVTVAVPELKISMLLVIK